MKIWSDSMKTKLNDLQIFFNRLQFNFKVYLQKIRLFLKSEPVILNKNANFDLPDQKILVWLETQTKKIKSDQNIFEYFN